MAFSRRAVIVAAAAACGLVGWLSSSLGAQRGGMFMGFADDPAIGYSTAPVSNVVDALNRQLQDGSVALAFQGRSGYLQSTLDALKLLPDSQMLVHSKASLQGRLIGPTNPRALFFDDRVAVAWVRDGDLLEIAAYDARVGAVFYTLEQKPTERPLFKREFRCLGCHQAGDTLGVPGFLMFSTTPDPTGDRVNKIMATDHRDPLAERFGGWFVTGAAAARHLGNEVPALEPRAGSPLASVAGLFDPDGYRAATSDIAALLTFSHQAHMANLLTRASWEARAADPALHPDPDGRAVAAVPGQMERVETLMRGIAEEVVDYMLFVDEAPLANAVSTRTPFVEHMSARGPRDRRGRSLYELDLRTRLLKYPCSYLIYSPAFDALPPLAKTPIYRRLWQVLSGGASDARYRALSRTDRRAIVEILKETKSDLPNYFGAITK